VSNVEQELLTLPEHMSSVFLRFTASDYPFDIFKLFLTQSNGTPLIDWLID